MTRAAPHPQIADLPIREGPRHYLRAVLACGGEATNYQLASWAGVSVRTIQRRRRRLEAESAICAAGFKVTARFCGRWQTTNLVTLPAVADRRRCECMSGSESPAAVTSCHPTYVREDQDQVKNDKDNARDPSTTTATTTATTGVRTATTTTEADSTGPIRSGLPCTSSACAPETPPLARRTPAKAQPATPRQLEYVAYLADGVGISPPNQSALTARSAHRAIQDLKTRLARVQCRELVAARAQGRREARHRHSEDAVDWARERVGYAFSARCDSCGGIHWAEPGGVCSGCGKQLRRGVITAAPDPDTAPDGPSATSTSPGPDTTAPSDPGPRSAAADQGPSAEPPPPAARPSPRPGMAAMTTGNQSLEAVVTDGAEATSSSAELGRTGSNGRSRAGARRGRSSAA